MPAPLLGGVGGGSVYGKRPSRNTQARPPSVQPGLVNYWMSPLLLGCRWRIRRRWRRHISAVTAGDKERCADQRQKQICYELFHAPNLTGTVERPSGNFR